MKILICLFLFVGTCCAGDPPLPGAELGIPGVEPGIPPLPNAVNVPAAVAQNIGGPVIVSQTTQQLQQTTTNFPGFVRGVAAVNTECVNYTPNVMSIETVKVPRLLKLLGKLRNRDRSVNRNVNVTRNFSRLRDRDRSLGLEVY